VYRYLISKYTYTEYYEKLKPTGIGILLGYWTIGLIILQSEYYSEKTDFDTKCQSMLCWVFLI